MNILGINTGHDSGATLLKGSQIIAINEERLSRIKLHNGFPELAVKEVLAIAELTPDDINSIIVEGQFITPQADVGFDESTGDWKKKWLNTIGADRFLLGTEMGLSLTRLLLKVRTFGAHQQVLADLRRMGFTANPEFADHHACHAASAYFTQEHTKGLAITLDASGEGYCSKVYQCTEGDMKLVHQIPCYHSPAYYYGYITQILGFTPMRHEGKITGLAAFGKWEETYRILSSFIHFNPKSSKFVNTGGYHLKVMKKLESALGSYSKEDIAAGIQKLAEELVCLYVDNLVQKYGGGGKANLFLAGGIFANVKINQRIDELDAVNSIYIFPNMGDGGLNLGAAMISKTLADKDENRLNISNVFWGKNYTDIEIKSSLEEVKLDVVISDNIEGGIAKLLSEKKIVCRFSGAMEYGPRALGNRSIIYEARDKDLNIWLNEKLGRTEFMPFAPFVRDVDASDYFNIQGASLTPFKYMTMTCNVTDKCAQEAPAVVHIDRTARPQIITEKEHSSFYKILTAYKELTGIGVLVNTSFNLHEEPIVNTPQEAIATFQKSKLNALAIGNFLIQQNND